MTTTSAKPKQPSNRQIAAELGIEPGTPGSKRMIQARRHESAVYQAYLRELEAWQSDPCVIAERERRAALRRDKFPFSVSEFLLLPGDKSGWRVASDRLELEMMFDDEHVAANVCVLLNAVWRRGLAEGGAA